MNCESCGAPLNFHDEVCEYCGTQTDYGRIMQTERKYQEQLKAIREAAAPPTPEPAPAPTPQKNLLEMRHASLPFLVVVYVVTLGLYSPYWYFSRSVPMKELHTKKKFPVWLADIYVVMCAFFWIIPFNYESMGITKEFAVKFWGAITYAIPFVSAWLAFATRKFLREHAANYIGEENAISEIAPSGYLLFFFGALYLQCTVNKMIRMEILKPKL